MAKLVGFIKISSLSSHFYNELHEYGQTPNNNASAFADALYHISAPSRLHHMPLPPGYGAAVRGERVSMRTHIPEYRTPFRFFAKKTEPKMPPLCSATRKQASAYALPGLKRRPRRCPAFRCPIIRAAVCDFLPLRLCDEMWIGRWYFAYLSHVRNRTSGM